MLFLGHFPPLCFLPHFPHSSAFVRLLLFVVRVATRVEASIAFAASHRDLAPHARPPAADDVRLGAELRRFLSQRARGLVTTWLAQAEAQNDVRKATAGRV